MQAGIYLIKEIENAAVNDQVELIISKRFNRIYYRPVLLLAGITFN
jgi:hypothetical protein